MTMNTQKSLADIIHPDRAPTTDRVYLSGPMTGLPDFNYPAFHAAADLLRTHGVPVINPAESGQDPEWKWADYLRKDIADLVTCCAIILLPGWSKSKGARLEHHIAEQLGMSIWLFDGAESPNALKP